VVVELASYPHGAGIQVNVCRVKRGELGPAKASPNLRFVPNVDLGFDLRKYAGLRVLVLAT
jgi:hypothetical protein